VGIKEMKNRTRFVGNVQTTYSDWSQSLVNAYPDGLKFELLAGKKTVVAYSGGVDIGLFNFQIAQGELFWDSEHNEHIPEKDPQYQKFDINKFIK
jgi:hypothetical protein